MIDAKRRTLLKGSLGVSAIGVAVSAGLLTPGTVLANWPKAAFAATETDAALNELLGSNATENSDQIKLEAPDIAENGAQLPVVVDTDLEGVQSISIIASANNSPLIASFDLGTNAVPFVSTRIKMAESADIIAVVKTDSGLFSKTKSVKVTIGGCGG
ncbi:thiosulfate oxidation carrier protein SoxY [Halochromatium salexigens]|uniref:Thiosulfate oxidation carrier protein SoxY n=1 Tax=Halochromatium salexigens TaxID=49447 RepID=A0AAJ0UGV5_HALSE|nr:thiosulfate oxidation carrier protein SoxY [Halochromatium salexigens]MBK5931073.1 thiosulfate oxidation carrier protein SoxY [Halochromatium salexigens]